MKRVTLTAGEGESLAPAVWAGGKRVVELELYRNDGGVQATAYAVDGEGEEPAAVTWAAHDEKPEWVGRWAGRCGFHDVFEGPERALFHKAQRRAADKFRDHVELHELATAARMQEEELRG